MVKLQQWYQESTERNGILSTQEEQVLNKDFELKKAQTTPQATSSRIGNDDGAMILEINERFRNIDKRLGEVEELYSLLRNDFFSSVTDVDRACTQRIEALKKFFLDQLRTSGWPGDNRYPSQLRNQTSSPQPYISPNLMHKQRNLASHSSESNSRMIPFVDARAHDIPLNEDEEFEKLTQQQNKERNAHSQLTHIMTEAS